MTDTVNRTRVQAAQRKAGDQLEAERLERIRLRDLKSRSWRVRAYWAKGHVPDDQTVKDVAYTTTVTGDSNLDIVLRRLELDDRYDRIGANLA